jgi:general secretion pathway protein D
LGVNWREIAYTSSGGTDISVGIDPISKLPLPIDTATNGATVAFGALSQNFDMSAVAAALKNANDARLLANPTVAVLENEEAIFKSVTEIPYQQLTQTQQAGQIGTTAFKEAGVTLRVMPKIAADGTIRMAVSPEFSRLTGFTPGDNQPIIDTRSATTTLGVANRQTIVIGGLRERRDIGDFRGVPYLMDMYIVGKLFRYRKTDVRESELVVFISPEIISTADTVNQREQMIIDTIGCRLNQIPEAEGCPPPPCVYPPMYAYPPVASPVRLPATEPVAEDPPPVAPTAETADVAAAPAAMMSASPRRLPTIDEVQAASVTVQGINLFDAPPPRGVDLGLPRDSRFRMGGAIEVGSEPVPLSR